MVHLFLLTPLLLTPLLPHSPSPLGTRDLNIKRLTAGFNIQANDGQLILTVSQLHVSVAMSNFRIAGSGKKARLLHSLLSPDHISLTVRCAEAKIPLQYVEAGGRSSSSNGTGGGGGGSGSGGGGGGGGGGGNTQGSDDNWDGGVGGGGGGQSHWELGDDFKFKVQVEIKAKGGLTASAPNSLVEWILNKVVAKELEKAVREHFPPDLGSFVKSDFTNVQIAGQVEVDERVPEPVSV